jgi:hypothetical protein
MVVVKTFQSGGIGIDFDDIMEVTGKITFQRVFRVVLDQHKR